jgi:4-hydroxybenzoate polyprenyltransferase
MEQVKLFIELARLKKPIGYMLLFWPCAWGLTLGYDFELNKTTYFYYLFLFLIGAILMRSAGCIVNDIVDRKFDKKVSRTKNRPLASGKVIVELALIYSLILCLLALIILLQFNKLTIFLALASMPLAFTYPLMKRFTYWPQLFLGITFNYGLILGWTATKNELGILSIILYLGAVFWTMGYDTIYGFQDIKDDEIIGVKSTSIKFKKDPKTLIFFCYFFFILAVIYAGIIMEFNFLYFIGILVAIYHLNFYQLNNFNSKSPENCLKIFKSNNFLGFVIFMSLVIGKF